MIALADCNFRADPDDKGRYVGRCREFPEIRTRPMKSRLDAIDGIVDAIRDEIRRRDSLTPIEGRF